MPNQHHLPGTAPTEKVEEMTFELPRPEPIKGYPVLHWQGKRPFTSTQFFPAQLKERYGDPVDGWMNRIYWGDNLQVMSHLLKEFRGKVDLVYIDPPFDSKADYKKRITVKGKTAENCRTGFEEKQYTDIWNNDGYLQYIYERIIVAKELLSAEGSIYIHCDQRVSSYIRAILDETFGHSNFRAWICWKSSPGHSDHEFYGSMQNHILFYTKSATPIWNTIYQKYSDEYLSSHYQKSDDDGRLFEDDNITAYGLSGGGYEYDWNGHTKLWRHPLSRMQQLHDEGRLYYTRNGVARYKRYLDEMPGMPVSDLWLDIPRLNSQALEKRDYPTQKPEALLERIIQASSKPGSIVFDCFMGSGTTQAVAMKLGRRFIGADINLGAIQTTTKRLSSIMVDKKQERATRFNNDAPLYLSFEVYNVNHYDVFRNPVQARELLIQALEVDPLDSTDLFDGIKDGYLVKIMPVNRIATRADLNPLISGMNYRELDKSIEQAPNRPAARIMLVCMGHEPDLAATLKMEVGTQYNLDVEVVDILRDKQDLTFKYDSEAEVAIEGGELVIRQFYPRNLLQKLSIMDENVEEWRELVETIAIDWNYNGEVLRPAVYDSPGKNELVQGRYPLPGDYGQIRVKITDLLSENLELTIEE